MLVDKDNSDSDDLAREDTPVEILGIPGLKN
jgi:hypothetical protein